MVALVAGEDGLVAFPPAKGSGSVTAFSQADGFFAVDALRTAVDAGTPRRVTLIGPARAARPRRSSAAIASALDVLVGALADAGLGPHHRGRQPGGRRGRAARRMRPRADAPARSGDRHLQRASLAPGIALARGWRRMQGVVFRPGDPRFEGGPRRRRSRPRSPIPTA